MERSERIAYEVYMTDCMYIVCAGLGNKPDKRYCDLIHPPKEQQEPDGGDVYERLNRFGIKVVD